MDYHSLKRSELQALCKKHSIPANSTNVVMADKLSELLHEKPKPRARQRTCIKSAVETIAETESAVSRRQAKRVRFSPEVEYERSDKKQKALEPVVTEMKGRRKSVVKKVDEPAVDNVNTVTDDVQIPVKVTRSRAHILEKDDVIPTNVSKRGRKAVKDVEKKNDAVKETEVNIGKVTKSKSNTVAKGDFQLEKSKQSKRAVKDVEKESKPVRETVVRPARVTRSKAQTMAEDSKDPDLSPQPKKQSGGQTEKHEANVELSKEVNDVAVRVTRSRRQTLNADSVVFNPAMEKKRTRRNDSVVAYPLIEKKRTVAENSEDPDLSPQGKKKSGKRTEKDVELSKEVKDVVVRVTRSRGQTSNDDSVYANPAAEKKRTRRDDNVVTIPPFEKKKTRRDPIVAEVSKTQDNADKGARQLRRNKAIVEDSTFLNQNGSKVESVNEKKVTRSKVPLENKSSRGKGKGKGEDKEDEEPLEPAGRNNVTRRKSVIQPKSSEVVLPLEEPLDIPARNTRRKSVIEPKDTEVVLSLEEPLNVPAKKGTRRKSVIQPKITEVVHPLEEHVHISARKDTRRKSVAQPKITEVVHHLEEHVHVPARKDTRRKSVLQPENSEVVLSLEEPVNVPAKRETRRKSVVQKAQAEDSKKLLVLKRETVKETAVPGSPSVTTRETVEKKQSTDASESELKAVASGSGSKKSGKRSIAPIIENQIIETELVSTGKDPVAKKEQRTGVKTPASRKGVMTEDNNRSIKRAKLSGIKQSDSEGHPEKSNTVETPISKMANLELDDKVIETEQTPAYVESGRRMTRGVSRSNRNEPSQSAIKEQNTAASRLTSRKTPGRFTRSGIKHDEKSTTEETPISKMANLDLDDKVIETEQTPANVKSGRMLTRGLSQSALKEQNTSAARLTSRKTPGWFTRGGIKIDEKAQPSDSTHQNQPVDDAQVASREDADASSSPEETIAVPSEVSKEANAQILEQSGDLSALKSVKLPTVDTLSDGSHVHSQNEEVHVRSEMVSEGEVQVTVNSEKSVIPEVSEMEMNLTNLSGIKQNDSENHPEKSNTERTPISKMANLELDDKVIETQQTFAYFESGRRMTRGVSRSDMKKSSQSAVKEQNTGGALLTSRKTPGQKTHSGIKVDEKAQPSGSTQQSQPLDDTQVVSREVAEASSSLDETIADPSEVSKDANAQILEQSGDISASESVKLPTVDALSDGCHVQNQNQEVHVSSEMISEAEVQVIVNSEKSAVPEVSEKEMELTKLSGLKQSDSEDHSEKFNTEETPTSKIANLELDDKGIETQQTSAIAESGRQLTRGLSRSSRKEPRQSAIKEQNTGAARLSSRKTPGRFTRSGSKVDEKAQPSESTNQTGPVKLPTVDALLDGSHVQNQNQDVHASSEMVSEAEVLLTVNSEKSAIPDVSEKEMKLTKSEYKSEGLENDARVEEPFVSVVKTVVTEESVDISLGQSDIKGKSKEIEALVEPSVVEGVSQFLADDQALTKIEDDGPDNEEDEKGSSQKHEDVADKVDTQEMGFVVEEDYVEPNRDDILEPSTGDDKLESCGTDENDIEDVKVTVPESSTAHREPDKEFVIEDKKEPATVPESLTGHSELAKELDTDAVPSAGNDVLEIPSMGQFDDEGVANSKEPESNTNDKDGESEKEFTVEAKKKPATVPESANSHSEPAKELDTDVVSSIGNDVHEIPILDQFDDEEGVDKIKDPVSNTNDKDGESEKELLTSCCRSAMDDQDVGDEEPESVQKENVPLLPEVFTSSSDQEPEPSKNEDVTQLPEDLTKSPDLELEPAVNFAENEAPCNTVNASTGKEAPQSPELVDEKEQTDCDKYGDDYLNHGVLQDNPTIKESLPIVCAEEESAGDRLATSQLPGVLGAYESPIRERDSSVDDIISDLPTSFKNEDKNKHEDWGNYSNGTDGLQNPVSANGSDDVAGRCMRDGQVSGHQTTSPAVANTTQEIFDWTDSTLKALLTTPGMAQDSHVKERQQSTVRFALPDKDDTEINEIQTPDLSLKTLFTTPATSQVSHVKDHLKSTAVRFDIPDEGYNATQNQYSSLKTMFATSATTRIGHIKEREQSTVRFALSDKGDREGNASRNPESSLKEKTPATTRDSHVQEPEQITVRSVLFAEDETEEHNATHKPHSSPKTLSTTPATTPISCVKDTQENSDNIALLDEDDNATQNLGTSLKTMFTTPTTMQFSHAKSCQESVVRFALPDEDDMKGNPPQNPDSSLKTFATRATSQIGHVKDSQQHEFNCALLAEDPTENPDLSLKTVFTTPVTVSVSQENVVRNALPDEDESESNATTQNSNVQDHEQIAVKSALPDNGSEGSSPVIDDTHGKATQNPYSSLKALFATPAKTQGSYVEENHQSTVRFALPGDSFHEDEKQGTATQHQNLDYSSGENVGKNQVDELNQHDMKSETAGTCHSDASGLKDRSNEPSTDLNGSPGPTEDPESEIFEVLNDDFARKLFGDEAGSGSSDNSGDEMKQHDTGRRDM